MKPVAKGALVKVAGCIVLAIAFSGSFAYGYGRVCNPGAPAGGTAGCPAPDCGRSSCPITKKCSPAAGIKVGTCVISAAGTCNTATSCTGTCNNRAKTKCLCPADNGTITGDAC